MVGWLAAVRSLAGRLLCVVVETSFSFNRKRVTTAMRLAVSLGWRDRTPVDGRAVVRTLSGRVP